MKVCFTCGSDKVMFDAYVDANNPSEIVAVFDHVICDDCGGKTELIEQDVRNSSAQTD